MVDGTMTGFEVYDIGVGLEEGGKVTCMEGGLPFFWDGSYNFPQRGYFVSREVVPKFLSAHEPPG